MTTEALLIGHRIVSKYFFIGLQINQLETSVTINLILKICGSFNCKMNHCTRKFDSANALSNTVNYIECNFAVKFTGN